MNHRLAPGAAGTQICIPKTATEDVYMSDGVRNIAGLFWDLRYIIVLCFSIQWLVFVFHAAPNRSQRYYDATGAVTYWLAVLLSYAIGGNVLRVSRPQIISL